MGCCRKWQCVACHQAEGWRWKRQVTKITRDLGSSRRYRVVRSCPGGIKTSAVFGWHWEIRKYRDCIKAKFSVLNDTERSGPFKFSTVTLGLITLTWPQNHKLRTDLINLILDFLYMYYFFCSKNLRSSFTYANTWRKKLISFSKCFPYLNLFKSVLGLQLVYGAAYATQYYIYFAPSFCFHHFSLIIFW